MSRFHASRLPAATTALVHVALGGFNISLCGVASATRGGGGLRGKARHELESSNSNLSLTAFDLVVIDDKKKQGYDSRGSSDSMSIVTSLEQADAASFLELNAEKKENAKAQKLEMKHTANREEGDQVRQGQNGAIDWSSPGVVWLNDVNPMTPNDVIEPWLGEHLPGVSLDPQLSWTIWDDCKQVDQDCTVTTTPPPGGQPPATQNATKGRCAAYYGYMTNSEHDVTPGKKYDVTPEQHGELWCAGLPNSVLAPGEKQKPAVANLPKEPDAPQKEEEQDQGDPMDMEGQNGSTPEDVIGPWLHADKEATKIDPAFKFTVWDYCKQLGQTCTCNTTMTTPPSGYDGVTPPATTPPDAVRGKCVVYAGYHTNGGRPTAQIHGNMFCEKNVATDALLAAEGTKQNDEGKTRSADGNGKTDANDKADDKKGESDALLAEEGTKQKGEEKTPNANGIGKPDAKEKADDKKGAATRVGISVVALLLPMGLTAAAILQ
mmetsp:Transcript_27308/g.68857  ORF Transcript_27308/g.68857 Transcript_27308/m.68857 type:complete len:492 (-) Transcript_27308:295-1770(-)